MTSKKSTIFIGLFVFLTVGCSETKFSNSSQKAGNSTGTPSNSRDEENDSGDKTDITDATRRDDNDIDTDTDSEDGSSGNSEIDENIDIDDSEVSKSINVEVQFSRQADNAAWTNCLYVTTNDEPEIYLGCNKVDANTAKVLALKSKPFCNIFKFRLTSNGNTNFTTASANNVRYELNNIENVANFKGIKFFPVGDDGIGAHVNDNGDSRNHTDTSFQIIGFKSVNYSIENTIKNCK